MAMTRGSGANNAFFKQVTIKGMKARPYMRPALRKGGQFLEKFAAKKIAEAVNQGKDPMIAAEQLCIAASDVVHNEASANSPYKTGQNAAKINRQRRSRFVWTVRIGTTYGGWLETGTGLYGPYKKAFVVKATNKKCLAFYWMKFAPKKGKKGKRGGKS